jgi:hypothetical protein
MTPRRSKSLAGVIIAIILFIVGMYALRNGLK